MIFLVISNERGIFEIRDNYRVDFDNFLKSNIEKKDAKIIVYEIKEDLSNSIYQFYAQDSKIKIRTENGQVIIPKILKILR